MIYKYISKPLRSGVYGLEIETEVLHLKDYPAGFIQWDEIGEMADLDGLPAFVGHNDGSLRNYGLEFVSRIPRTFDEIKEDLEEFGRVLKDVPFIKDAPATSVHVHVNIGDFKAQELGNLLTLWVLFENILVDYCGEQRATNLFALPTRCARSTVLDIVRMFAGLDQVDMSSLQFSQNQTKYGAINLSSIYRFGSLEFRSMRGTTDKDEIIQWVTILNDLYKYSRRDITPLDVMAIYRESAYGLFEDVFKETRNLLDFMNLHMYTARNAWSAGQIAWSVEDWHKIDEKLEAKYEKITSYKKTKKTKKIPIDETPLTINQLAQYLQTETWTPGE